jgi:hypothetical protein
MKPVVIDLCCGRLGWSKAFIAEGWEAIGFDIEPMIGGGEIPDGCTVIRKSILEINGYDLRAVSPALVVASPPCQEFSYMAMPWKRGKQIAAALMEECPFPEGYDGSRTLAELTALYRACFRIAREIGCPIVLENVKGAQPWVGRAQWHAGPYYLWGDVPALMPHGRWQKGVGSGSSWFYQNGGNDRSASSHSQERKEWTAQVAQIPEDLARWIARCFKPTSCDLRQHRRFTSESPEVPLPEDGASMCRTP